MLEISFIFESSWRNATTIKRQLESLSIPFRIQANQRGVIVFLFPELIHREYNHLRRIFIDDSLMSN